MATHAEAAGLTVLLEGIGLSKHFGGVRAVQDLSFTVEDSEILGLIGPNGAGKSTVFNLINGVYPPDQGKIIFAGAARPDRFLSKNQGRGA
jgi:branched-chain amino acid transport system ATP-binding protein